jgi:hypothetical protein
MTDQDGSDVERRIKRVLGSTHVTFCVDTNILVEFKALDQIPWGEIAPNATEIRIVVPTKVGQEMDDHKNKTGRLRHRALDFLQIQRSIEESATGRTSLRDPDPKVTIEFDPYYRRDQLDSNAYDLDDADERIVAEAARFMADQKEAILLGDDGKVLRLARKTGLLWKRPPESWRRKEGPDERDKEIEELKRQLGPQPLLSIAFPGANDRQVHVLESPPVGECPQCSERLATAVFAVNPKISREESIARYGLASGFDILGRELTESDLQQYEDAYADYEKRVHAWGHDQTEFLRSVLRVLPIEAEVANNGGSAAESVLVEFTLTGDFHFLPMCLIADLIDELLEPPDSPRPRNGLVLPRTAERTKPHEFFLLEDASSDGSTKRLEWRCEEFRQGHSAVLLLIVRADENATGGALEFRVTGAKISKVVEGSAPLRLTGNSEESRVCTYLERRIKLFPDKYREIFRDSIGTLVKHCSRDDRAVG